MATTKRRIRPFSPLALVAVASCSVRAVQGQSPIDVGQLVDELTSEAPMIADGARRNLEAMGTDVVPVLFEKLLLADWTLRPRLLEVLSAHGRDFAKKKFLSGNDTEKVYAALVYELSVACAGEDHDYESPEFKAMVDALLKAIKSEDKNLRAAAGYALVYDERSTVFFQHFHEIVPALIASFDSELIIDRRTRGGPAEVVHLGISLILDALIGDRLAYLDFSRRPRKQAVPSGDTGASIQRALSHELVANRGDLDDLRTYWTDWWKQHSNLAPSEIGALMIERDVALLEGIATPARHEAGMAASYSLRLWTGQVFFDANDAKAWWNENRSTYRGPGVSR